MKLFLHCTLPAMLLACALPASSSTTRVYQWHQPDGTPVMSNAPPPSNISTYTVRDLDVPAPSRPARVAIAQPRASARAVPSEPAPATDDALAQARRPSRRWRRGLRATLVDR